MTTKARPTKVAKRGFLSTKKGRAQVVAGLTDTALTGALKVPSLPKGGLRFAGGRQAHPDLQVVSTKLSNKAKSIANFLRSFDAAGVKHSGLAIEHGPKGMRRKQPNAASIVVDDSMPVAERLQLLGASAGSRLDGNQLTKVLRSIRAGAEQITGSGVTASEMLSNTNFDGTGMTVEELVRKGRAGRVLSRLDDLRYGARG